MNRPDRFVSELTDDEITALNEMIKNYPSYRVRRRAHAVLLSCGKFCIDDIASACGADRDTVSSRLKAWETEGMYYTTSFSVLYPGFNAKFRACIF